MFNNKIIAITGGTGSFGKKIINSIISKYKFKELRIISRDEMKQWFLQEKYKSNIKLKFIIGDVRDKLSLDRAINGSDYVVHAAATKIVPTAELNPVECIKTNINGAINVINSAIEHNVKKVIALSTDKACNPINLYGATKLCSDKLFIAANFLENNKKTVFSVVRYGNVMGSRGSVIPFFVRQQFDKEFTITDKNMTRFMITLDQAVDLVFYAINDSIGGEIYVSKIPSMKVIDIAKSINSKKKIKYIGIRPGEKLHEVMCPQNSSSYTIEFKNFFVIAPSIIFLDRKKVNYLKYSNNVKGKSVKDGFEYSSDKNKVFLKGQKLKVKLKKLF